MARGILAGMLVPIAMLALACTPDVPPIDSDPPEDSEPLVDSELPGDSDPPVPLPSVVINELMADNDSAVATEEGAYPDWLELYNAGDSVVDLSGFALSDDWTEKDKAPFPDGVTLEPGGYLLLWADDSEQEGHLPFKLSAQGEGVGLFTAEGIAVDWLTFPPLAEDHAYARIPDGSDSWEQVARGTPGSANARVEAVVTPLVERGADWRYLDTGVDPGEGWADLSFDDSGWAEGPAPLGYGDSQTTQVSYGDDSSNKHITTWFRHAVEVPAEALEGASELQIELRIDDGGLVWLNGVELFRQGMSSGEVDAETYASHTASGDDETSYTAYEFDSDLLLAGGNQLAVEVHQHSASSSDISFDLSLSVEAWVPVE